VQGVQRRIVALQYRAAGRNAHAARPSAESYECIQRFPQKLARGNNASLTNCVLCVISCRNKWGLYYASLCNNTQGIAGHGQLVKTASGWIIEVQGFVNGAPAMGRNPRALRTESRCDMLPKARVACIQYFPQNTAVSPRR
jgi:hypothetical protein